MQFWLKEIMISVNITVSLQFFAQNSHLNNIAIKRNWPAKFRFQPSQLHSLHTNTLGNGIKALLRLQLWSKQPGRLGFLAAV